MMAKLPRLTTCIVAAGLPAMASHAANIQWDDGGVDDNWTTAANWAGDVVPGSSDIGLFNNNNVSNVFSLSGNLSQGGWVVESVANDPEGGISVAADFNGHTFTTTQNFEVKLGFAATLADEDAVATITNGTLDNGTANIAIRSGRVNLENAELIARRGGAFTGSARVAMKDGIFRFDRSLTMPDDPNTFISFAGDSLLEIGIARAEDFNILNDQAQNIFELNSTGYLTAAIDVSDVVTLDSGDGSGGIASFSLASGFSPVLGQTFNLISAGTAINGVYSNLSNGQIIDVDGVDMQASYTATTLSLTVVPEPASLALLGLGGALMLGRKRPA